MCRTDGPTVRCRWPLPCGAPAVGELLIAEKLRLDAVPLVVAEFAPDAFVADEELEQLLPGLWLPRGPAFVVEQQVVLAYGQHDTPDA